MKKQRRLVIFGEDVGKLLLDLGKLIFGSIIIGGILRGGVPHGILIASGIAAALIFFLWGLHLTGKEKLKDKE